MKIGAIVAKLASFTVRRNGLQSDPIGINKKQNRQASLRWGGVPAGAEKPYNKIDGASPIVVGLFGPLFVSIRGLILFYIYVNVYIT